MIPRRNETKRSGILQGIKRQRSLTDPAGLALLLGSTVVMMAVALFKAQGLPAKGPRGGGPRR